MKNALLLSFSLLIVFCLGINVSHSAGSESKEFNKSIESGYTLYSVRDSSDCTTTIDIGDSSLQLDLWHGKGCQADIGNSIEVAAANLNEIVKFFDLYDRIKKVKLLTVNIGVHISGEQLVIFLNTASDWPNNYIEHFKSIAPSGDEAAELYREYLRSTILESGLYTPIFNVVNKWGCEARLSATLFDPLFFDKHKVTGKDLIKWGVFGDGEAMKELFPSAKGGLEFEMNCSENENRAQPGRMR